MNTDATDASRTTVEASELRNTLANAASQIKQSLENAGAEEIVVKGIRIRMKGPVVKTLSPSAQDRFFPELRAALLGDASKERDLEPTIEGSLLKRLMRPNADLSADLAEIERRSRATAASPANQREILLDSCIDTVLKLCVSENPKEPLAIPFRGEFPRIDPDVKFLRENDADERVKSILKGLAPTEFPLDARFREIQKSSLKAVVQIAKNDVLAAFSDVINSRKDISSAFSEMSTKASLSTNRENLVGFVRAEAQKAFEQEAQQQRAKEATSQADAKAVTVPVADWPTMFNSLFFNSRAKKMTQSGKSPELIATMIEERVEQFIDQKAEEINALCERNVQNKVKAESLRAWYDNRLQQISNLTKSGVDHVTRELEGVFDGIDARINTILESDQSISFPSSFAVELEEKNPVARLLMIQGTVFAAARNIRNDRDQTQEHDRSAWTKVISV
ncbi:MAG TPA: hypothetical protein VGZ00_06250 [Candidatus Baltobacteraceae bacterium]|nr:hypothetical protein [Candidatus Baltobacteraceae bacterium]